MSLSIPSDNLRKINNLDEIPYKNVNHHKVYNNYLNHMNYLLSLSEEDLNNQIEKDINDYNNYIDLIISKNNRISSKVKTEYNNLLTKLTADKRIKYLNDNDEFHMFHNHKFPFLLLCYTSFLMYCQFLNINFYPLLDNSFHLAYNITNGYVYVRSLS